MKQNPIQRLIFVAALVGFFMSRATASSINDPVVAISGTSTSQQTVTATVTLSNPPNGAVIAYTTDGTPPTMSSPSIASGESLLLAHNATLKVQAFQNATTTSDLITTQFHNAGMVSSGSNHSLILTNAGTVFAAGDNSQGELGIGNTSSFSQWVQVQGPTAGTVLTGIIAIAAGNEQSYAVNNQGQVFAWGQNAQGGLGTGTSSGTYLPTQIPNLSGIVGIASAGGHTLALAGNGTVYGWGANSDAQVGTGTASAWITQPTLVVAPTGQSGPNLQNVVAVAVGANHSLALTSTGNVLAWGDDSYGQLGDSDTSLTQQATPVFATANGQPFPGVVGIAAGATNSYALGASGQPFSWGANTNGELGQGTTSPTSPVPSSNLSPAPVVNLPAVAAVSNQSALGTDDTVKTWGNNANSQLGVGLTGNYATVALTVPLALQADPTLTITAGNGQTVTDGSFSTPLTVTATNNGSVVPNALVTFGVSEGLGVLGSSSTSNQLSPIFQALTGSNGQASVYMQEPAGGAGTSQVVVTDGSSSQASFSVTGSQQENVPVLPTWLFLLPFLLFVIALTARHSQLRQTS